MFHDEPSNPDKYRNIMTALCLAWPEEFGGRGAPRRSSTVGKPPA
jgi:hypothetical protein